MDTQSTQQKSTPLFREEIGHQKIKYRHHSVGLRYFKLSLQLCVEFGRGNVAVMSLMQTQIFSVLGLLFIFQAQ